MLSRVLGGIGRVLVISGLFILGFVAFQLWGTSLEESRNQSALTDALARATDSIAGVNVSADDTPKQLAEALAEIPEGTAPATAPPAEGEPVGIMQIERIGLTRVIVHGVSKEDLKQGPGHYPGTPLPGQSGNSGIAGHRTTYGAPFNRIDELQVGDEIVVSTTQGQFTYRVVPAPGAEQAWYVVDPSEVSVLSDFGDDRITLTACHPKYSAKQRIIVHAVLDGPVAPAAPVAATTGTGGDAGTGAGEQARATLDDSLEGNPDELLPAVLFAVGAAAVLLGAWALARYWRRAPAWALGVPAVLVLVWFSYVHLDRYLPAL